jgi:hypothetical protein
LGVVYIKNDDSLTPVYNLRGCEFKKLGQSNIHDPYKSLYKDGKMVYINKDEFIYNGQYLDNTLGVFKNPAINGEQLVQSYDTKETTPWYYKITFSKSVTDELRNQKIKGAFIVRQKRIPTVLGQGLSVGVDATSYIPTI